ncbi:hypothetical protein HWB99_gp024 [Mycobacterium phage DrLupo]|uniref:Uncharacterized protein n=1 Tax=Mycobacterium phage DrLupo TaxID=2499037 RepID=A0A3S9UQI7_9CAUD|nr:hypothetical protein HWB99_gp024 [Mycobacterium phage DrLupo]AZS12560.1 hypothetical protein SEA_DRLUPO_24 [Mycobacterium phage DrLupo]
MSLVLDPNRPWTKEEKEWARSSGRGYMVETNERRFPGGKAKNAARHEKAGEPPESAQFGALGEQARQAAVYDVGGVALPGTTLDYDTGRALQFDAEGNGVAVEPNIPVNSPGAFATVALRQESEGFGSYSDSGDDIDDDIVDYVLGLKTKADVQKALDEANANAPEQFRQSYTKSEDRDSLNDKLALVLQDTRHPEAAAQARQMAQHTQPPALDAEDESMLEKNTGFTDDFADDEASPASGEGDDAESQQQNDGPETDAEPKKSSKK